MSINKNFYSKIAIGSLFLIILLVSSLPEQGIVSAWDPDFKLEHYSYKTMKINIDLLIKRILEGSLTYVGRCGNGELNIHEQCDDGNTIDDGNGCSADCGCNLAIMDNAFTCPNICGDGVIIAAEECDDGNEINYDGCSAECEIEELVCGNGILELGEECDAGPGGSPLCNEDCTIREPLTCFTCVDTFCAGLSTIEDSCPFGFYDSFDACMLECNEEEIPIGEVPVPPDEDDILMCEEPNPLDLPEGTRFRDAEDGTRHISVCEEMPSEDCTGEDCSRHIICRPDGGITVNVIPCPEGSPCVDGACIGDPTWHPECLDSDRGINPRTPGGVWESGLGEEEWHPDYCATATSILEGYCLDGTIFDRMHFDCTDYGDYYCDSEEGACVSAEEGEVACSETDEDVSGNGNNPFLPGVTTMTTPVGSSSISDGCSYDQTEIMERFCNGDYMDDDRHDCNSVPGLCDADECRCEVTEEGAMCVPGELPVVTCLDEDLDLGEDAIFLRSSARLDRGDGELGPSMVDNCASLRSVGEAVCVGNRYERRESPCPPTYNCHEGACVSDRICSRTEATETEPGYVTDITGEITPDICTDDIHLEIYGCGFEGEFDGLPVWLETVDCSAAGAVCRDGLCV